jgi:hypothetical protein
MKQDNYTQFMMKTKAGKEIYKATKKVKDKIKHRVMIDSLFQQFGTGTNCDVPGAPAPPGAGCHFARLKQARELKSC